MADWNCAGRADARNLELVDTGRAPGPRLRDTLLPSGSFGCNRAALRVVYPLQSTPTRNSGIADHQLTFRLGGLGHPPPGQSRGGEVISSYPEEGLGGLMNVDPPMEYYATVNTDGLCSFR